MFEKDVLSQTPLRHENGLILCTPFEGPVFWIYSRLYLLRQWSCPYNCGVWKAK